VDLYLAFKTFRMVEKFLSSVYFLHPPLYFWDPEILFAVIVKFPGNWTATERIVFLVNYLVK
jgi:hypothetical protein